MDRNASIVLGEALKEVLGEKILIFCIGTDKYIIDSLAPLLGSLLIDSGISLQVFGTLDSPIHAENIEMMIKEIKNKFPEYKIIAIDACLGDRDDVGLIKFKEGSISPGAGISKKHTAIGDYKIKVIIEKREASNYLLQLPIRLRYIFKMAVVIRDSFKYAYSCIDMN